MTDGNEVPFLKRTMLAFQHGVQFQLRIRTQSDAAQILTIRGMTKEGIFTFVHTPLATGAVSTSTFNIPDIPIFVSVSDESRLYSPGQVFVVLDLLANNDKLIELCSGTPSAGKAVSWPTPTSIEGRPNGGYVIMLSSANPAAGVEASYTVPTNMVIRPMGIFVTLVTGAAAAARRVHIRYTSGASWSLDFYGATDQAASLTRDYSAADRGSVPADGDATQNLILIPSHIYLKDGDVIKTVTTNLQGADDFTSLFIYAEVWWRGVT